MKLFPHILVRVSGGAFEQLETLNLKKSLQTVNEIHQLKKSLTELKEKISQRLYQTIPQRNDPKARNLLLNFRRNIFNDRYIPADALDKVISYLPKGLKENLKSYFKIKESIGHMREKGEDVFSREVTQLRKNLHALAADEKLQKGLLLSSQSLLKRIPAYTAKESHLQKKDLQTERGLVKYISRMYAKTSPFSTFTNLVMAKPASSPGPEKSFLWLENDKKAKVINHIRLNNYLYHYLETLLCKNPDIYPLFLIRPNPTLKQGQTQYLYLTNNNNIEAFQRIPVNPVLEVFRQLTGEKKEGIPFNELVRTIIANEYIDASAEDIQSYILQLIEYGFLEFNIGVSGIDPDWDIKLGNVLHNINRDNIDIPLLSELPETLKNIRTLACQYGEAPFHQRNEILEKAFHQFKATCMKLHEAAGLPGDERKSPEEDEHSQIEKSFPGQNQEEVFKHQSSTYFYFKPEQMFYEDTTLDITPLADEQSLMEFIASLHGLLQQMRHFEGHRDEQDKMRYFFIEKYGKDASVELMTFYEEYYREFKKPEAEFLQQKEEKEEAKKAAFTVPAVKERQERNKAWLKQLTALLSQPTTLKSFVGVQGAVFQKSPLPAGGKNGCSYGSFIQFYKEKKEDGEEKLMGVLNASFPGFGKLFSRFLHIFDNSITDDMRKWNESLTGDSLLVEDCDASYFNANLHPPLMPYEVRIPGGHNSLPPGKQIPITELRVGPDETGKCLQLLHEPSQKRVYIFDLGFQGHKGRSQLFQLLEKFTLTEILFPMPLVNAADSLQHPDEKEEKEEKKGRKIRINPRVVYDDRLILRRKTWHIPREKLPYKISGESFWDYFLRVDEWRSELQVPGEVFVYVVDRFQTPNVNTDDAAKGKRNQKVSRDDYKPQYISFNNPFLIDLLEKIIKRVPDSLKIVEMLPNSRQLLKIGQGRHITEFTVQWYTQAGEGS